MANNNFYARIQQKIDIEENWNKAVNFVPLKGEIIIYDIDSAHDYKRIKIGDGVTTVINLEFVADINDLDVITVDLEGSSSGEANPVNADTLGGYSVDDIIDEVTPVKGVDYWTDNDKQEIITEVEADAIQIYPLFANSVEELKTSGDPSKVYVLPDGLIYAYMTKITSGVAPELLDRNACSLNMRISGTSEVVKNGYYITDYIPVDMSLSDPIVVRFKNGVMWTGTGDKLILYDANKNVLAVTYIYSEKINTSSTAHLAVADGNDYTINLGYTWVNSEAIAKDSVYNQIAYFRINQCINSSGTALTVDKVPNVSITIDAMGGEETVTGWMSTGHAFVPQDYEDRIIDLEETSESHAADIDMLNQQVENLASGASSAVYPSYWETAVQAVITKIKAAQQGVNCVTFPFFSDNHQRNGYSGALIRKVMDECHIPFCFYGGDSIDSGYIASEAIMIEQDAKFDKMMKVIPNGRFCRAVGNHDGYWAVSANEKYTYTRAQVYELFLREEAIAHNKHFGSDGTYYYVDDVASKVRFIVLNTNGGSVDSAQISWLQNTAMSFNESGWAIVFISHQPISNHYHANISNASEVRTIVSNYINGSSTNKADIVGWYSGHIHRDRIYTGPAVNTTDDSVGTAMPFKQVTITSDHTSIAYDDATKHTVANDDKSHAIDFVTINKDTKTVTLTRLGIGEDRSYTY